MDIVDRDLRNKAIEKLKEKTIQKPCIECGNEEWNGSIYRLSDGDDAAMPCYRLICKKCGYIRLFNLGDLLS